MFLCPVLNVLLTSISVFCSCARCDPIVSSAREKPVCSSGKRRGLLLILAVKYWNSGLADVFCDGVLLDKLAEIEVDTAEQAVMTLKLLEPDMPCFEKQVSEEGILVSTSKGNCSVPWWLGTPVNNPIPSKSASRARTSSARSGELVTVLHALLNKK